MVTAAVSVHNQVREVREVANIKVVNLLLEDPRWIYMGNHVVKAGWVATQPRARRLRLGKKRWFKLLGG